jgi:DNA-binding IclR family transcriptional regulator
MLDGATVERVLGAWQQGRHADAAARHVPLFYPPGPDGVTVARLAERTGEDEAIVARLLAELHELGYLDVDGPEGAEQAVALTLEGYDLLDATESVLLETARERGIAAAAAPQNSG